MKSIEKLILNDVTPFHVQWSGMRRKKCGVPTGFIGVMAANQHWTQYKCSRYTKLQCGQGHKKAVTFRHLVISQDCIHMDLQSCGKLQTVYAR